VSCSKTIKNCHKLISCKTCKKFVHKKCTKLKTRELKNLSLTPNQWECGKCKSNTNETLINSTMNLNVSKDLCVTCCKTVRNCHKNITCKICSKFVHKKCTGLTKQELQNIKPNQWACTDCKANTNGTHCITNMNATYVVSDLSISSKDLCVTCCKIVKSCHKNIVCKICKKYVHKKCTNLKPKNLRNVANIGWECIECKTNTGIRNGIDEDDTSELNTIIDNADFTKYDEMFFNPLRYEELTRESHDEDQDIHHISKCPYLTPKQCYDQSFAKNSKFSIININIRSLSKNFDKLKECLKALEHDFTIIGLSETHLKDKPHDYYQLNGYKMEYTNRIGREKGGVCLYISEKVKYKLRNDLNRANANFESCFIEIEIPNKKNALVGVIYRAHTAIEYFVQDVDSIFQIINKENKVSYVMGDFNIDLLKDDSHSPTHNYLDFIYSMSLIPTIYKPTRITENTATLIDNILTNANNPVESAILVTNISDHLPTILVSDLSCEMPDDKQTSRQKHIYKRKYTNDNVEYFKQELKKVKWNDIFVDSNVNSDYDIFVQKFNELLDKCIPLRKCTPNNKRDPRSPWITKCILKSINTKNKLYKKYLSSPTSTNLNKFKTFRNKLNSVIKKSKSSYFSEKFQKAKGDMRQTWKTINNVMGRGKKQNLPNKFKDKNGETITDPINIANEFNNFFVNVGPDLAANIQNTGKNYHEYLKDPVVKSMFMKPIVEKEIIKIIGTFNPNKSAGHDNIDNKIIKKVANEIAEPLTIILNLSFATGIVPENLKIAKVIPIYKKADADNFSNYRPVSVLPCFSKILERLVFNRCIDFIDNNDILNKQQFGFRAKHSTYMAVIQVVEKIHKAVESGESTLGIFLDLSKAFDTIDHSILLHKLQHYGFRGIVYDWFESYLQNRKQYVTFKSKQSNCMDIICGVPQGSILGPLLFILYVNDIVNTSNIFDFTLFADDTTILYSHKNLNTQVSTINRELSEVSNWFKANKLSVNASKTYFMILGTPQMTNKYNIIGSPEIILDDTILDRVTNTKFLGVIIDENIKWKLHIEATSKTVSRNIGVMNKLKHYIPERILHSLYCSLVMPYINYGILVWGNAYKTYVQKIFKLQKRAMRVISNSHYRSHAAPLFSKFNITNVYDTFHLELGVFMYKYINGQLPSSFNKYFIKRSDIHKLETRYKDDFNKTRNKKCSSDRSVKTNGPILWNSIEENIKKSKSLSHFRIQFKKQLLSEYR